MREILEYPFEDLIPDIKAILAGQGMPSEKEPDKEVLEIIEAAFGLFEDLGEPAGLIEDISKKDFDDVYHGEGLNKENDPVSFIYPKSDYLALFAVTAGHKICDKINELFKSHDYALAVILDAVVSEIVEQTGIYTEHYYMNRIIAENGLFNELSVLRYSPGYCGWHISGQKRLFEYLEPEEIGITLNDSYLMRPLKSISGVMIVGRPEIHKFETGFSFCDNCQDSICQDRINSLFEKDEE